MTGPSFHSARYPSNKDIVNMVSMILIDGISYHPDPARAM
jgi:hypothetical protein